MLTNKRFTEFKIDLSNHQGSIVPVMDFYNDLFGGNFTFGDSSRGSHYLFIRVTGPSRFSSDGSFDLSVGGCR